MAWIERTRGTRAGVVGLVALALLLLLAGATVGVADAAPSQIGISSCGATPPRAGRLWADADAVFGVDLSTLEEAGGGSEDTRTFDPVVQLGVSEVFKGSVPATVTLHADPCNVALGVGTVDGDPIVAATRNPDGSFVFLGLLTRAQADAFGGELPAATGHGPVGALAAIDGGPFDLVAVDRDGAAVGFRVGTRPPAALALCPDGVNAVAFEGDANDERRNWQLTTIDVATMRTTAARPWPSDRRPTMLACTDREGTTVDAFVPARGTDPTDLSTTPGLTIPGVGPSTTDPDDELGGEVPEAPEGVAPLPPPTTAPSSGGTQPSILHIGATTSAEVPTDLGPAVGVDAEHRFLAWADPQATTLAAIDPVSGAAAATHALPQGARATAIGVSPDGTAAVVAAVDPTGATIPPTPPGTGSTGSTGGSGGSGSGSGSGSVGGTGGVVGPDVSPDVSTPFVDETPIALVLVDLDGTEPARVVTTRTGVTPGRLGLVDDEIVVVWTGASAANDGQRTTEHLALDGTVSATSTQPAPTVAPGPGGLLGSGAAGGDLPLTAPGLAVDPLGHSGRATDPRLVTQEPRLFGTDVGAIAYVPGDVQVTVGAQAARPAIPATPRPNGGAPTSIDHTTQDRLTIVTIVVAVGLLALLLAGLYRNRPPART